MAEVIGHEKIVAFFEKVIKEGQFSHAYCFVGPEGVGKKLMAEVLAAQLLNTKTEKLTVHPDFVCVAQEYQEKEEKTSKDITVKQIRELRAFLSQSAYLGKYKVAIIDNAEKMNSEAANALLKTLEEPTPFTVLFLLTSDESLLPGTVVSRTQVFYFPPVAKEILTEWLTEQPTTLDKEQLIQWSLGLPGKIKNWLIDPQSFSVFQKEVARFEQMVGKTFFEKLKIVEDVFTAYEDNVVLREEWNKILGLWRLIIRDGELIRAQLPNQTINHKALVLPVETSLLLENKIIEAQSLLNKNINPRLLIENLLLILP